MIKIPTCNSCTHQVVCKVKDTLSNIKESIKSTADELPIGVDVVIDCQHYDLNDVGYTC